MKRVLILAIAVIMILAFAACADNDRDKDTATATPAATMTAAPTTTAAESPAMTATTAPGDNGNGNGNGTADEMMFTGTVSAVNGQMIVVTPNEGERILSAGDKIEVNIGRDHNFVVGDKVRVMYEGEVVDGDPVKVNSTKVEEMS